MNFDYVDGPMEGIKLYTKEEWKHYAWRSVVGDKEQFSWDLILIDSVMVAITSDESCVHESDLSHMDEQFVTGWFVC